MRYLLTTALLLAIAAETRACDYSAPLLSYGYAQPVQQFYAPQQFVVPAPAYYAPTVPLQFGYSAPLVQSYSLGYSQPFVQSYGLGVSRVRVVSPFSVRVGGFGRSRIIIR